MLRVLAKVQLTVDRGGIIRGTHSTTDVDFTELHEAVDDQLVEKTKEVVQRGDEINRYDHALRNPLILAARGTSLKIFTLLLDNGGDLTSKDCWGLTAMDWCVITGKPQWLRACKEHKPEEALWDHAMALHKEPEKKCKGRPFSLV